MAPFLKKLPALALIGWIGGGVWFVSYMDGFIDGMSTAKGLDIEMPLSMMAHDFLTWPYQIAAKWIALHQPAAGVRG